jgi:hypothetical protein
MLARLLKIGKGIMRRLLCALFTTLLLALAGCSGDSSASSPTSSPSSPPSAPAAPATASPSPSSSSGVSASECLSGRYRLIRFVGVGERGTYGTGEGGDVTLTFNNGSYLLRGAGKDPINLTLAGQRGGLLVDGTIGGDYQLEGNGAKFTVGESSGSATLNVGKAKQSVPISAVANVLAPSGDAGLGCGNNALIVTLQDMRLELGKV